MIGVVLLMCSYRRLPQIRPAAVHVPRLPPTRPIDLTYFIRAEEREQLPTLPIPTPLTPATTH